MDGAKASSCKEQVSRDKADSGVSFCERQFVPIKADRAASPSHANFHA